jgi:hypothetical protein
MKNSRIFSGLAILIFGILLLLDNLGLLPFNPWMVVVPIGLILLGASFIWGSIHRTNTEEELLVVPLEEAVNGQIKFKFGAGRITVGSGASEGNFLNGKFSGGVEKKITSTGQSLELVLSVPPQNGPFQWSPGDSFNWDIKVTRSIPLSLEFDGGAAEIKFDLSDLLVENLSFKTGASSSEIVLPGSAGFTHANINTGAASVVVKFPPGVSGRIRSKSALASVIIDKSRFPKLGEVYVSPDWDTALNKVDLEVSLGVGSIEIH